MNKDWMASLIIKERINANHMDHKSILKDPSNLQIEDFIPSQYEKSYMLDRLVSYYTHRLVTRHPMVFNNIRPCVKVLNRI